MFPSLAKGQEELKALITKEKKEKIKKPSGILNMGRSLKGPIKRALEFKEENYDQEEDDKSMKADVVPQNLPSHILQDLPRSSFKISQGLHSPMAS